MLSLEHLARNYTNNEFFYLIFLVIHQLHLSQVEEIHFILLHLPRKGGFISRGGPWRTLFTYTNDRF